MQRYLEQWGKGGQEAGASVGKPQRGQARTQLGTFGGSVGPAGKAADGRGGGVGTGFRGSGELYVVLVRQEAGLGQAGGRGSQQPGRWGRRRLLDIVAPLDLMPLGPSGLLWEDAGVCVCACLGVTGAGLLGRG